MLKAKSLYHLIVYSILFIIVLIIGILGNYISKKDGLPNRNHLESNENFEKQFIRTLAQNDLGVSLLTKVLGYKPINDYIKSTSDDMTKKYILVIGDSHAHTSYHGFEIESKNNDIGENISLVDGALSGEEVSANFNFLTNHL